MLRHFGDLSWDKNTPYGSSNQWGLDLPRSRKPHGTRKSLHFKTRVSTP